MNMAYSCVPLGMGWACSWAGHVVHSPEIILRSVSLYLSLFLSPLSRRLSFSLYLFIFLFVFLTLIFTKLKIRYHNLSQLRKGYHILKQLIIS